MKIFALLLSFSTIITFNAFSQTKDQLDNFSVELMQTDSDKPLPYYVIITDSRQLQLSGDDLKKEYGGLSFIDPSGIDKISIYKDEKANELFGKNGDNGVIVISLKMGKVEELPDTILAKFEPIDEG